jgi:hypothetical protein
MWDSGCFLLMGLITPAHERCHREIPGYSATFQKSQKTFTLRNPQNYIWYPVKERKGPAILHIQTTPVQKGKQDSRQTYFNGSSAEAPFQKIAQAAIRHNPESC